MLSPVGRVWRSIVIFWGWDTAVLVATAFAGHPATLCWADGEQWVCRDITQKTEHTEGRTLGQPVERFEKLGKSSVCYSWRTDVLCLHRDTYLCISSKATNSPGVQILSQIRHFFRIFLFSFFSLLFILVRSIKSMRYHDALTFPFHASISL